LALHEPSPAYGLTDDDLDAVLAGSVQRFNDLTI
jgi:hypothetical protein